MGVVLILVNWMAWRKDSFLILFGLSGCAYGVAKFFIQMVGDRPQVALWDGVRNYQARNFLRQMQIWLRRSS